MQNKIKVKSIIIMLIIFLTSICCYAYSNLTNNNDLEIEVIASDIEKSSRVGDGNLDGGGGDLGTGTSSNKWSNGDEGVRVTVVAADTGEVITRPIDFTNKNPDDIVFHFGKVSKTSYVNGKDLVPIQYNYTYYNPETPLPTIIASSSAGNNIEAIKQYFCSEYTIKIISNLTGITYENLISGKYKILLEPVAYVTFNGNRIAFTATECALYDEILNGGIRSQLVDFSHKNLPLSMYLEKDDLGYKAWEGSSNERVSNEQIISRLGLGIVKFQEDEEEKEEETIIPQYTYRTNTVVYTSLTTSLGMSYVQQKGNYSSGDSYADLNPVKVTFSLSDSSDGASIISQKSTAYKSDDLVYVKWQTPSEAKTMKVIATISYPAPQTDSNGDYVYSNGKLKIVYKTETVEIPIEVVEIEENTPPNPTADDTNSSFKMPSSIPTIANDVVSNSWTEYEMEVDSYDTKYSTKYVFLTTKKVYSVSFADGSDLYNNVYTDPLCETYTTSGLGGIRKLYTMKSRYGVRQEIESKLICTVEISEQVLKSKIEYDTSGEAYTSYYVETETRTETHDIAVAAQKGVTFFSEFGFENYFRLLEPTTDIGKIGTSSILQFKQNRFSTYNNRTYFTPIWYPDDEYYILNSYIFDAWTPAGMLGVSLHSVENSSNKSIISNGKIDYTTNGIYINGNLWDDWHIAPMNP